MVFRHEVSVLNTQVAKTYSEICEAINYAEGSQFNKERLKKEIKKDLRHCESVDYTKFPIEFRWNLCSARLRMGRFDNYDGWEYRSDWSITFHGYNGYRNPLPKWAGQPVKKLIVLGEQGIGDEIVFSSAIPELLVRGLNIELQCHPRLQGIFERSFGIKCVDRQYLSDVTEGDAVVALGDLMMFYRRDKSHFPKKPFLKPDPGRVKYWKGVLDEIDDRPKIGIAWKARHGSLDPKDLMFEDATYINLQYADSDAGSVGLVYGERSSLGLQGPDPCEDIEDHINLIAALDKVVSVTQTVIHEAGAIGKECHAIRPKRGTGEVNNSLWYYGSGNCDHQVYGSVKVYNTVNDYQRLLKRGNNGTASI